MSINIHYQKLVRDDRPHLHSIFVGPHEENKRTTLYFVVGVPTVLDSSAAVSNSDLCNIIISLIGVLTNIISVLIHGILTGEVRLIDYI
jgi:hypothetical protein